MHKPVSILALDDVSTALAEAVQKRVAARSGLDDLVQSRSLAAGAELADTVLSIHAQRQRPDGPLRARDDISTREMVLLVLSAAGPARTTVLDTAERVRRLFEMRRLSPFFTIEILCLLPEVIAGSSSADYAAAYGLLKTLNAAERSLFDAVWLLDATNASRVKFGALDAARDAYADAIAGMLTLDPEMSGALPGVHPRGMPPVFSAFGCAELVFPREVALQRVERRFAKELLATVILAGCHPEPAQRGEGPPAAGADVANDRGSFAVSAAQDDKFSPILRAKQIVVGDAFAKPLERIGVDAGQSLFQKFQPKTVVTERTRNAEELIAAVRGELKVHRDGAHLQHLERLARQGEQTAGELAALVAGVVDETLDRSGYAQAIDLLEALLDPLPELRPDADLSPRNLVTELTAATATLDRRLAFLPNTAASDGARRRVRELATLIHDQKLVADAVSSIGAVTRIEELEREQSALLRQIPELLFAEERENSAARSAARDAEAERLAADTLAREQELRDLFTQLPRVEQNLREALEERRLWMWKQVLRAATGVAALYAIPFLFGVLGPNLERVTWAAMTGLGIFGLAAAVRYVTIILPRVREARELLARIRAQIEATDKVKNAAHNEELRYEYDVALRRTTLGVLGRTRELAKLTLDALRERRGALEQMLASFAPVSIATTGLAFPIIDDGDVDAWYERTGDERKPLVREFPIRRSESRHLPLDVLRTRIESYAATAFAGFRMMTIGAAAALAPEPELLRRLRRFVEASTPLIELRDDDLPAQQAMQRDTTLWLDTGDATFASLLRRRLPDAHVKPAPDGLRVQALSRVLHFPGYVLGQIEYYRAQFAAAEAADNADDPDLLPLDLALSSTVRAAYEQVLLGRALGVIEIQDGQLVSSAAVLGDTHLAAAERLASPEAVSTRKTLDVALAPRLSVAGDVERDLRQLMGGPGPFSPLDRGILGALVKRYASEF